MMNDRRKLLTALGAGALTMATRPGLVYAQEKSITVTSLGGRWEQSIRTHFAPLFKQRTGADVRIVLGGPAQWTSQILAQPSRPPRAKPQRSHARAPTRRRLRQRLVLLCS